MSLPTRSRRSARALVAGLALALAVLASIGVAFAQVFHPDARIDQLSTQTLLALAPDQLVDPFRQHRADVISADQQLDFIPWALAPIVAFFWLWRSGNAARLRNLLSGGGHAIGWMQRATFGAALGVLAVLVQSPFALTSHRIAGGVGLSAQSITGWFVDEFVRMTLTALASAVLAAVVLAFVARTRLWYLWVLGFLYASAIVVVAVEPVLFAPLATSERPAPAQIVATGDQIAGLIGTTPVQIEIVGSSERTNALINRTAGMYPFDRIVLGDTTVTRVTSGEMRFLIARSYVHLRDHDNLMLCLIGTTLFIVAAALGVLINDRIGFRRDDDSLARFPLVLSMVGVMVLIAWPIFNRFERARDLHADRVAIAATGDPASAVRFLVRRADDDLIPLCGLASSRWYFGSHAALGTRIAQARGTDDPCARP